MLRAEPNGGLIQLDFPNQPAAAAPLPEVLAAALGAPAVWSGRTATNWLVELGDAATVRALNPDLPGLAACGTQGVIVTAAGDADSDFVSRYFAPAVGIPEDPVTGSAHCTLAPYWAPRFGRDEMVGHQVSARGSRVGVRVAGDRVLLSGPAVTVITGSIIGWV